MLILSRARTIYARESSRIENPELQARRLAPRFNVKFEYLFMNVNNVFIILEICGNIIAE